MTEDNKVQIDGNFEGNIYQGKISINNVINTDRELPLVLDQYLVDQQDIEKNISTFVRPKEYDSIVNLLNRLGIVLVIGQSGIGKRTLGVAVSLQIPEYKAYIIPRFFSLSQLDKTRSQDALFILPDALGAVSFERENLEGDLFQLENLVKRNNRILITCPDDVYIEASKSSPRFFEWLSKFETPIFINSNSYSYTNKIEIYKKIIHYTHDTLGKVSDDQKEWGLDLALKANKGSYFQKLISDSWLPIDIERFVTISMPTASKSNDLLELLRRDAIIDNRIHAWFMDLDASTQCFILTLCLFVGFESNELWMKYREIVTVLKKFNQTLSIHPLGIVRQKASPYVTESGTLDFTNPRVYRAVINEVSKNYREYFIELIPLLKKWSIPEIPDDIVKYERDKILRKTEETRNRIGHMVGEIAKYGFDEIEPILESWATHSSGKIAKTAGIALRDMTSDPNCIRSVFDKVKNWAEDYLSPSARYHRWTAGSALWRIASTQNSSEITDFSLKYLGKLAGDSDKYVVSSAAYALRMMARTIPFQDSLEMLFTLAENREKDRFTMQQVANAIDEFATKYPKQVYEIMHEWIESESENAIRTTAYILFINQNIIAQQRHYLLEAIAIRSPNIFWDELNFCLEGEENIDTTYSVIESLLSEKKQLLYSILTHVNTLDVSKLDNLKKLFSRYEDQNLRDFDKVLDEHIKRNSHKIDDSKNSSAFTNNPSTSPKPIYLIVISSILVFCIVIICSLFFGLGSFNSNGIKPKVLSSNSPANQPQFAMISNQIGYVNLRKSPGYINKDSADVVTGIPSGERVQIINGPEVVDNLRWWHIKWNEYQGWIAEHTTSGKVIIEFQ